MPFARKVRFRPIADIRLIVDAPVMRCFYVLVHGRLSWSSEAAATGGDIDGSRPLGFYCHRYILASGADTAKREAFRRVRENFENQTGWLAGGCAALELRAEEVAPAPIHKLLRPDNKGHSFYEED